MVTHPFEPGGGCMSRCRCGATFSDPVHGEQPENIKRLRAAIDKSKPPAAQPEPK